MTSDLRPASDGDSAPVEVERQRESVGRSTSMASTAAAPRILLMLGTDAAWCRGILRGFTALAHERNWAVLHYRPDADVTGVFEEWQPAVIVVGPDSSAPPVKHPPTTAVVAVNADRSAAGVPCVCLDEVAIAQLAADHLLATGLKHMSTVCFDASPWAQARVCAFEARARASQVLVVKGFRTPPEASAGKEDPAALVSWLRSLPKPCGIFTCSDQWGRTLARYAQLAGVRVPEEVALIGVDNDTLECELSSPPLSSVLIPWREVGEEAAELVSQALSGELELQRRVVAPLHVVSRRSSDVLAVDNRLVADAVAWIRSNAERRLTVGMVIQAVGGGRQRLERAFRRVLDRTIQEEIRRSHVDVARRLLETTQNDLTEIARRSGFSNATLLNLAFQRELQTAPGAYRRRMLKALSDSRE